MTRIATLVLSSLLVFAASVQASEEKANVARIQTIQTDQWVTLPELAAACHEDHQEAAAKAAEISARLAPEVPNALTVRSAYYQTPIHTQPGQPPQNVTSSCVLEFRSKAPLSVRAFSAVRRTRIPANQWDTACAEAYAELASNPDVPVAIYWKSWSLIQGRICEVTALEVKAAE